jgi:hypothetical protein
MANQVKGIYNKTRKRYLRHIGWELDYMVWVGASIKGGTSFRSCEWDDLLLDQLEKAKRITPNDEIEVHTFEVIPKQYKKVD